MNRRDFMKATGLVFGSAAFAGAAWDEPVLDPPIVTTGYNSEAGYYWRRTVFPPGHKGDYPYHDLIRLSDSYAQNHPDYLERFLRA